MKVKAILFIFLILSTAVTIGCDVGIGSSEPSPLPPPPNLDELTPAVSNPDTGAEATVDTDMGEGVVEEPTTKSETAVAETPTQDAEPTPTLAPTAVPQTSPPIQTASNLPPTSRDLVFIGDGALKLWTHHNRQLVDLFPGGTPPAGESRETPFTQFEGDITHLDVSADGNRIVAARITRTETMTRTLEGGSEQTMPNVEHEILFLDVVSKETWVLAENVTDLRTVKVSPNQQVVAFIGSGLTSNPNPEISDEMPQLNVYTVLTPDKGNLREVASCVEFCNTIVWHPNNELFFFADADALWLYNLSATAKVIENSTNNLSNIVVHAPISVANNGRYLLIWQGALEGGSYAVYDIPTNTKIPIPNSFVYADPFPTLASWMSDTRLLVTRNEVQGSDWRTTLQIYRVDDGSGSLNLEETTSPGVNAAAAGTLHLENGRFAYALIHPTDPNVSGLYIQTSFNEPEVKQDGALPGFVAPTVAWSPTGDGAIFVQNNTTYFGGGGGPINMTPLFGQFSHSFVWLPSTAVNR